MSRIGRLPIPVPSGVDVTINGRILTVTGPKGQLTRELHPDMTVKREEENLVVTRPTEQKTHKQLHGLTRTLVNNMVVGVTDGYRKGLEITGVGYRAVKVGEKLQLSSSRSSSPCSSRPPSVTVSHGSDCRESVARGIRMFGENEAPRSLEVENPTRLAVIGIDKELVGQVAAKVRSTRKPEPYKGKGVRYAGERIRRKAGKAGKIGGKK